MVVRLFEEQSLNNLYPRVYAHCARSDTLGLIPVFVFDEVPVLHKFWMCIDEDRKKVRAGPRWSARG